MRPLRVGFSIFESLKVSEKHANHFKGSLWALQRKGLLYKKSLPINYVITVTTASRSLSKAQTTSSVEVDYDRIQLPSSAETFNREIISAKVQVVRRSADNAKGRRKDIYLLNIVLSFHFLEL